MQEMSRFTRFGSQKTMNPGFRAKKTEIPALSINMCAFVMLLKYHQIGMHCFIRNASLQEDAIITWCSKMMLARQAQEKNGLLGHISSTSGSTWPSSCRCSCKTFWMIMSNTSILFRLSFSTCLAGSGAKWRGTEWQMLLEKRWPTILTLRTC